MNNSENDIEPNICAVFVEPHYRGLGLSRLLLDHICQDMAHRGIRTLYLLTDHDSYYEKLGWTFREWFEIQKENWAECTRKPPKQSIPLSLTKNIFV